LAKSSKLASEIISAMGLVCLRAGPLAGHAGRSKVTIAGIDDRKAVGERVWFRNAKEAEKVETAFLSRCLESTRTKTGLTVNLPPGKVVDTVCTIAFSLGITPIRDVDVATTFDSVNRRVEAAIATMGRQGTLKRLRRITELDLTGLLARQSV
jgi:hypothetical protein